MSTPGFELFGLTGREYKMMLKPAEFAGFPDDAAAKAWQRLKPILGEHLEAESIGFDAVFGEKVERGVRFRDTDRLALDEKGYSLRVRDEASSSEVSLKLRTPDIILSGSTDLSIPGKAPAGEKVKEKFEEDIAPLEVQTDGGVTPAAKPSTRSRFSRSTKRTRDEKYDLTGFEQAFELFPPLAASLAEDGVDITVKTPLKSGPRVQEHVFRTGGTIDLKDDVRISFALTLWYFDRDAAPDRDTIPDVAELSFQQEFEPEAGGEDPSRLRARASRTQTLFLQMQTGLRDWLDLENSSKTKMALPKPADAAQPAPPTPAAP
jgi:hypothetical protein